MNVADLYRRAWKVMPYIPMPLVYGASNLAAEVVWLKNPQSVRQMRRNFERFVGGPVPEAMVRRGVRSYFRAFAQQFTMPGWSQERIEGFLEYPQASHIRELMKDGPVILALTHSGNWDGAGASFRASHGGILTVAEKLDPPELFDMFVEFRESRGLEILGVAPGEHVFGTLVERARGRELFVPLLADRDISGSGIEVQLGASRALVAAGPAALALALDRPLVAGHLAFEKNKGKWTVKAHFTDPIACPVPEKGESRVEAWTRAWVGAIHDAMSEHLVDWHMMQKVFVDDLDPARLARAQERAALSKDLER